MSSSGVRKEFDDCPAELPVYPAGMAIPESIFVAGNNNNVKTAT
jgi:hypothetical protein